MSKISQRGHAQRSLTREIRPRLNLNSVWSRLDSIQIDSKIIYINLQTSLTQRSVVTISPLYPNNAYMVRMDKDNYIFRPLSPSFTVRQEQHCIELPFDKSWRDGFHATRICDNVAKMSIFVRFNAIDNRNRTHVLIGDTSLFGQNEI
jgi:hypothetical protein